MLTVRLCLVCALIFCGLSPRVFALETDQFTLPRKPLRDIAPEVNGRVFEILKQVVARANYDIAEHETAAAKLTGTHRDRELAAMKQLLSERYIAQQFADVVAPGLPECRIKAWVRRSNFGADAHFKVSA